MLLPLSDMDEIFSFSFPQRCPLLIFSIGSFLLCSMLSPAPPPRPSPAARHIPSHPGGGAPARQAPATPLGTGPLPPAQVGSRRPPACASRSSDHGETEARGDHGETEARGGGHCEAEATARAGLHHRRRTASRRWRAGSTPPRADGGRPWPPRPSRRAPSPHQLSSPRRISSLLRHPCGLRPSMLPLPLPRLALLAARRRPTRGARSALVRPRVAPSWRRDAVPRGGRGAALGGALPSRAGGGVREGGDGWAWEVGGVGS